MSLNISDFFVWCIIYSLCWLLNEPSSFSYCSPYYNIATHCFNVHHLKKFSTPHSHTIWTAESMYFIDTSCKNHVPWFKSMQIQESGYYSVPVTYLTESLQCWPCHGFDSM